jgi:aryl-alcohol dehydrogenase-like predicted oxidoreductase
MAAMALPTNELGATGMRITRIGLGAWAIGGDGWGPQDDADSVATIERALELGINWIDTAAVYGFGHSEEVVGKAIAGLGERPYVFTKASLVQDENGREVFCQKRDSIRREIEDSLSRLGLDAVDLYQIHWPFPEEDLEEGWTTFKELKEEGLVRHIGVSNYSVPQLRQLGSIAPVETLQPPFSLVDREAEAELLPYCEREGIGVIAYSPMGSGLLTGAMSRERVANLPEGDWRKRAPAFREPELSANLETAERVKAVAADLGVSPGAVAAAWTLRNPAVDGAIVGLRHPDQVDDLIGAASLELNSGDQAQLDN